MLGDVALQRDGARSAVATGKVAELLVRLALEAGAVVRTDRLIEDLWADHAHGTARNTLQAKVSRLRRALGDPGLLVGSRTGYTLAIDRQAVDALAVLDLPASAAALRRAGDPAASLEQCLTALGCFSAEVLPGGGDADWVVPHRQRLEDVRLSLLETMVAARLDLGASGELIGELEGLVREHPLREALWSSLMIALYRAGRQADALAAYGRVRGRLADELGLEPGPALQAVERQILLQDPSLDAARRAHGPVARTNAPALTSPMIGRDEVLQDVARLLHRGRLLTIVGPAGVGKTRLAVEAVRSVDHPGGAWLVRLDSARDAASVLQAVGEALGVAGATQAQLLEHLRGSRLLLALDNCEQVVDAVGELVSRVLDAAPWVDVLCTSQRPLGLAGEATCHLEPLAVEDSTRLFTQLAAGHRASAVLDGDTAAAIVELCLALDGLPLAIELAAARVRTLTVQEIARRLQDRFAVLTDPTSRLPERRRALGAAIGWSYDLLFPDDQRGLWALACFAGDAPLSGLEHVLGALDVPGESAIDVLSRLADRSLVTVDERAGEVRYRLLQSIRAFALARLHEAGLAAAGLGAHAEWYGRAAARAAAGVRGPDQAGHLAFVRLERANLDAALAWSGSHDPALGLRIANGFGWAWFVLGDRPLGAERVRRALSAAEDGAAVVPAERVTALCHAAWLTSGDVRQAHAYAERALTIATEADDDGLRAASRAALAFVLLQEARAQEALDLLDGVPAVQQRLGRRWDEAAAWILTVHAALTTGDTVLAAGACRAAEAVVPALADDWALGHLHAAQGFLAQVERRFADAATHLRCAAEAAERLGFRATESLHLSTLGRILQQAGDPRGAVAVLERAIELGFALQDLRVVSLARTRLGRVLRTEGDADGARAALRAADRWFESSGGGEGAGLAACLRAAVDAEDGDPEGVARLRAVLAGAELRRDPELQVLALDALARSAAHGLRRGEALDLLDRADRLLPSAHHLLGDADRLDAHRARRMLLLEPTRP